MAEIATNVLHNVGNVLNSINVSGSLISTNLKKSRLANLAKAAALLQENAQVPGFLTVHEKGKLLPDYFQKLATICIEEQGASLQEIDSLIKNVEHINKIVSMQQSYASMGSLAEKARLQEIIEDAIRINHNAFTRHKIKLIRDFQSDPEIVVERHKLLQILVNLLQNAKEACEEVPNKEILVRILPSPAGQARIEIIDNGIGIPPENLAKLFTQGFTTRKDGHGFGLHTSINAAREMKGNLTASSKGSGLGATFSLELPGQRESSD